MSAHLPYILLTAVFLVGMYCIVSKKNLIKIVVGLAIAECAVNLFLVTLGYNNQVIKVATGEGTAEIVKGGSAPIETAGMTANQALGFVDPLPQALVLTSIVVGLSTLALAVAVCVRLYDRYRTYDISEIKRLRG
ncbi:MAG: sodium:proton antiporter [Planctomycetota bacterium]|jgi:multicomponent Na+:H+ antiporter subunit C